MVISAESVKALREKTGAGMMDCKSALTQCDGDVNAAIDFLRAKGLANAEKKADRVAAQGLVSISVHKGWNMASIIELNSETDFVAKNDKFQSLAANLSNIVLESGEQDITKFCDMQYNNNVKVKDAIIEGIAVIGENINLRRIDALKVDGVVESYVHGAVASGMGKIGVIIAIESTGQHTKIAKLGKELAMQVAAYRPIAIAIDGVNKSLIERETSVLKERLTNITQESGGTKKIDEAKFLQGGLAKFYSEVVLMEQIFLLDSKKKVSTVINELEKEIGATIKITKVIRYQVGEEDTSCSTIVA